MASSDLATLKDMGFDEQKAELSIKKGGNLQGALDWLEKNQDKTIEILQEEDKANALAEYNEEGAPPLKPGEVAQSLRCKDCGKKLRTQAQAEFHASKTEHMNFEESTEDIAPLTEEEKKAKLDDLRAKLAAKRATQSEQDKIEQRRNEEINRKKQKDQSDIKEELAKKEQVKEAQRKRQDQIAEREHKELVMAKIKADQAARREKAKREKAARAGQPIPILEDQAAPAAAPSVPKTTADYKEARLRLQTPNGIVQKTFPVETTLFEVGQALAAESGFQVSSFTQNFPKKVFDESDMGQTLKEAGMVPSAALIVK